MQMELNGSIANSSLSSNFFVAKTATGQARDRLGLIGWRRKRKAQAVV
jgi:hypothetical protein